MTSYDCPLKESPIISSCAPTPSIMRPLSFLPVDSSDGSPTGPSPRSMSISDAQWLVAVRSHARKLYLHSTVHKIPCVKPREGRVTLECDDDDDEEDGHSYDILSDVTTLVGTPSDEDSICFDAKDDTDAISKLSEAETIASATRVKGLLQKLSLKIPKLTLKIPNKDGSVSSSDDSPAKEKQPLKSMDWSEPQHLEGFLVRCVEGWEMQSKYIAQQARMQRAMARMQRRIEVMEDQSALLAWYANHLKGDDTSSPPPSSAAILQEAETAVLVAATSTMASAVDVLEKTA